jgi:hypothetical protein
MTHRTHHISSVSDKRAETIARELRRYTRYGNIDAYNEDVLGAALHLVKQGQGASTYGGHYASGDTFWFSPDGDSSIKVFHKDARQALAAAGDAVIRGLVADIGCGKDFYFKDAETAVLFGDFYSRASIHVWLALIAWRKLCVTVEGVTYTAHVQQSSAPYSETDPGTFSLYKGAERVCTEVGNLYHLHVAILVEIAPLTAWEIAE